MLKLDKLIEIESEFISVIREQIPMIGHLPFLKYLKLNSPTNVRSIRPSFIVRAGAELKF